MTTEPWTDQKPGTWRLSGFKDESLGATTELGDYPSFRACVEVARVLAKHRPDLGAFRAGYLRTIERLGAEVDGFSQRILLDGPGDYDPDVELRLRDGRVMWLSDFEDEARQAHVRVAALEARLRLETSAYDGPPDKHQLHVEIHDGKLHLQCDDCPQWHPIEFDRPTVADLESFQAGHHAGH